MVECICCRKGKVILPPNIRPPEVDFNIFLRAIRKYNTVLQLASLPSGQQVFTKWRHSISGSVYHLVGPLHLFGNEQPKFGQLYTYDVANELEIV